MPTLFFVSLFFPVHLLLRSRKRRLLIVCFWNGTSQIPPVCALGIIKDGNLIYTNGYGMANLEYDIPIDKHSVFRIGSTSKQFTAACIVLLAGKGKLNMEDRLSKFFPDFPEYADKITVRHLLNHTSGIRDYLTLSSLKGYGDDDFYEDKDIMKWLVNQQDLNFAPGSEYLYSNSGYWLLGQIVNQVAGKNMAEFAKEEIFDPLEMTETHFHNDHTKIVKNRATGYRPVGDGPYKISMTTLDMIGDGGIFTSVNDILKWDNAFYSSDVLTPDFWSAMTEQGVLNNGDTIDYAAGLFIADHKGLKTVSHGGAFVGFRADLVRFPEHRLSVIVFANRADANPTGKCFQVADIMLKDYMDDEDVSSGGENADPVQVTEFDRDQLVGTYEVRPGIALEIRVQNDSLNVLQKWNGSTYGIFRIQGNTFQIPGNEELKFTFSDIVEGSTSELVILQNGRKTVGKRIPTIDPASVNMDEFVGKFYSEELDVVYEVSMKDDSLSVTVDDNEPERITPYDKDQFSLNYMLMRFQRTGDSVTGFLLDAGRVKDLKFQKM